MTDSHFETCLQLMQQIHEKNPTLRFGEVIQGAIDKVGRNNTNLFDVSTKEIKIQLENYLERYNGIN